jgi:glutathione S-transferase
LLQARERADELRAGEGQAKLAEKYPKLWEYLRRLEQEPGYKRAEAKIEELQKTK